MFDDSAKPRKRSRLAQHFGQLLLFAASAALVAQAPPTSVPPNGSTNGTGTLRVNTDVVILDVSVTDSAGRPVTDLAAKDFRVTEDRAPQTVRYFEAPAQHTANQGNKQNVPPVVVHTSADLAKIGESPITIIVLDELNMSFAEEVYSRERVMRWVRQQPATLPEPVLLTALTYTDFRVLLDTTQDRDHLLRVLETHTAAVPWRRENVGTIGGAASDAMAITLGALEQIAQSTRGLSGRKNLFWVGDGFPTVRPTDLAAGSSGPVFARLRHVDEELFRSRITLTIMAGTVKPPNRPTNIETSSQILGDVAVEVATLAPDGSLAFSNLAAPTGGVAYTGRNDIDAELAEAESAGDTYYTLTYTPSATDRDPRRYRKVHVEVLRPGMHVQTRDGYFPLTSPAHDARPSNTPKQQLAFDLYGAANSRLPYTDLHLSLTHPDLQHWTVHVRAGDLGWQTQPDGMLKEENVIFAACFSKSGKLLSRTFHVMGSNTAGSPVQLLGRDIAFDVALTPPPETARVRFVVRDNGSGRLGAVDAALP